MAGAIRMVSLARGHDPRDFVLFPFGGAGPLHAAALARELAGTRPTKVIVTNGNEPLAAASKGEVRSHASLRAVIKGVNGAGDSFAAGTIYGLAAGHALNDAIRFGRAAALLTLEAGGIAEAPFSADTLAERLAAGPARIAS